MKIGVLSLCLVLSFSLLTGCQISGEEASSNDIKTDSLADGVMSLNGDTEQLIMKKLIISTSHGVYQFNVELALTDSQRKIGLMDRKELPQDQGMLFMFEKSGILKFWMKNTLIPLDMIFMDENGEIVHIVNNAAPCFAVDDADCPKYGADDSAMYVLEINGGMSSKLGISVGDKATWL